MIKKIVNYRSGNIIYNVSFPCSGVTMHLESTSCIPILRVYKESINAMGVKSEDFAGAQMEVEGANDSSCDEEDDNVEYNTNDPSMDSGGSDYSKKDDVEKVTHFPIQYFLSNGKRARVPGNVVVGK